MRLESDPADSATLEEVFRAAHSLKGTARMLGVGPVETLAHHLEDELGGAKRGRVLLDAPSIDRLCSGVDAIRLFVEEAVSNTPASIDLALALARMSGQAPLNSVGSTPIAEPAAEVATQAAPEEPGKYLHQEEAEAAPGLLEVALETQVALEHAAIPMPPAAEPPALASAIVVAEEVAVAAPELLAVVEEPAAAIEIDELYEERKVLDGGEVARSDFKIQTMRVPPARLDALMTLASELSVTTNRVSRGMAAFDAIQALAEEWRRDVAGASRIFGASVVDGAQVKKLAELHERERTRLARLEGILERLKQTTNEDMARLSFVAGEMEDGIRNVRLLPFSTIFNLFARPVRDLAREQGKEVQLLIEGGETRADKRILEELKDPLLHMIRNAIDHGIETPGERQAAGKPPGATLLLRAFQTSSNVVVELRDDGRGLDTQAIKRVAHKKRLHTLEELDAMAEEALQLLIFAPSFSTSALVTDVSGRGVGMDVVRTNVEKLKGAIQVRSQPGEGCAFHIRLPITLATTRVLLVEVAGRAYALPIEFVHGMMPLAPEQFFTVEGRGTVLLGDKALSIARLSDLLEIEGAAVERRTGKATCVVLAVGEEKVGLLVDALIDEQEVMLKPLGAMLKRVRNISGATILGAGEVCLILNPHDLLKTMQSSRARLTPVGQAEQEAVEEPRKIVLLAEDSLTTRTLEKRILEAAGYEVVTAVDGADALAKLGTRAFDAVVSDIEMPNLSGLGLAQKIREDARYNEMPIILVTSLASEDDRRRGAEAGANAYITKGSFEQKALLDALGRLV